MTCRLAPWARQGATIGLFSETLIGTEIAFRAEVSRRKLLKKLNRLNGRFGVVPIIL